MFTAKIYDVTDGKDDMIGTVAIDDKEVKVDYVVTELKYRNELEAALMDNVEEITDLHNALRNDPDSSDSMGVELETFDHLDISVVLTPEEDA